MQTFLPYPDFYASASVLDRQRLGKQRVEVLQLMNSFLRGSSYGGWKKHPAREMWRTREDALSFYGVVVCDTWISRGYRDTCREKILRLLLDLRGEHEAVPEETAAFLGERYRRAMKGEEPGFFPLWFGDPAFHAAHRSNLLRKNPGWYGQFGWKEPPDLPYLWPGSKGGAHEGS